MVIQESEYLLKSNLSDFHFLNKPIGIYLKRSGNMLSLKAAYLIVDGTLFPPYLTIISSLPILISFHSRVSKPFDTASLVLISISPPEPSINSAN